MCELCEHIEISLGIKVKKKKKKILYQISTQTHVLKITKYFWPTHGNFKRELIPPSYICTACKQNLDAV